MKDIHLNELTTSFYLELCKVNRDVIGVIPSTCIDDIKISIKDINSINLTINKQVKNSCMSTIFNPLWNLIKDERLICLNRDSYFVIKVNTMSSDNDTKKITAHSLEYKLGKIDINVEDLGFQLFGKDESKGIYSLNDYMKSETGWSFGYVDDSIRYDIDKDGVKKEKVRWQDSISMRWYDFLIKNISESYGCIADFDTKNKQINLYDINTVGEDIQIYLSKDNYIKSVERTSSSEDIVTRLTIVGSEEMDIIGATTTGYPYLENYSYFIDNDEMSDELMHSVLKYEEMIKIRDKQWKDITKVRQEKMELLNRKKDELFAIYEEIKALKSQKEVYSSQKDTVNEAIIIAEITKKVDQQVVLEVQIKKLEEDVLDLKNSIDNINKICKRETATDENGALIFNDKLLNELKDFIYCDTYTNDSFLKVEDLIEAGKRELELSCSPKISYDLDIKNFMERIVDNEYRQHWSGRIGLCDIVILYDKDIDKEVYLYLNGYTQKPNSEDSLEIELSTKKIPESNIRVIGYAFKNANMSMKTINKKMYLLNKQKYNRINLDRDQVVGTI